MIDVGQGDCFLIQQPFNKGNILIDTGGLQTRDLASTTLVPYLNSAGDVINWIMYLLVMMILIIVELISHLRIKLKLDILLHHTEVNLKLGR